MVYYTLTLITIFSVISPIFKCFFLQHFYMNTLCIQLPYSTVIKLYIICFFANVHTTAQFFAFFFIGEATMGRREFAGKTRYPQRFMMHFSSFLICFIIGLCSVVFKNLFLHCLSIFSPLLNHNLLIWTCLKSFSL